jgi:MFS superfamily sulfate permease-like transporter
MSNYGCKEKKKSAETLEMIPTNNTNNNNDRKEGDKKIIINFSMVNYIDEFGVKCLEKIIIDYRKESIRVCLTNCNGKLKY